MMHRLSVPLILATLMACSQETPPGPATGSTASGPAASGKAGVMPPPSATPPVAEKTAEAPSTMDILGTVRYKDLEGGFYAIDADDGGKYDPMNLPEDFRRDGLRVKLQARPVTDMMSFRMYGQIIEVLSIAEQ